jgi:DNA-directed RNA polymerase subunit RPC12/RpoP
MRPTQLVICAHCGNSVERECRDVSKVTRQLYGRKKLFCSKACAKAARSTAIVYQCSQCSKDVTKRPSEMKKSKRAFCGQSCAALYNNAHKMHGYRRSKLEKWLEEQLKELYPELAFSCNDKTAINSELDFYFPSIKLGIELNGIFHYEPIYGPEKLERIQVNDDRKFKLCAEKGVALCVIDTSAMKHFKEKKAAQFLDIIRNIIQKHL